MKAIIHTTYGSPDVLKLQDVEKPTPTDDQVLVKVHAASANPLDWHFMRGTPHFMRMDSGFRKPKNPRLGADLAGTVEAVGKNITEFKVGDEVFGSSFGVFAEYFCIGEDGIVHKPANITVEQAASVGVAAITALQGLRDSGKIQSGQQVLINGASGGVGTFAVQMAKAYGAEVTGVCSTRNLDMVRSIGADHVIDYTKRDFTRTGQKYDLIYDAVGNRSVFAMRRALKPNGICAMAGFTTLPLLFSNIILGGIISKLGTKHIGSMGVAKLNRADLLIIKDLLESGKVVPVIEKSYPLSQTAEAIRHLETGHARGKLVITVA